ncbi:hypothetical protein AGABI1DRAFT_128978 [Agaricus bisporus var. burnettii JB137-S8]|uniref:Uncharacterized protein n=1 Tax=Agaricus bisporus var. burnettii (strain JB137-S8 / ATCC MYA-4627 / FGSC 10392) TaxID=597362 RepID=K5X688_AGABU|nr:uncharacterized protein AGABI1DRAFT_128978 [Agaricus bisporus var. burnettii JB137-S8]EKM78693.1 hypothetical protein AGABI1DRAFT_128978 [Agaricus bisporus var. burnettii JB137-S8]
MFPTLPSHSVGCDCHASPGAWYNASHIGLQVSRSNSPQSSIGSPVCTPYPSRGSTIDNGCGENLGYVNLDACSTSPTKPIEGLGLHTLELPKSSSLRPPSEPSIEMLTGFGAMPFPIEYAQGLQHNDIGWQDRGADFHCNGDYTETPLPQQISRTRSHSVRGAGTSLFSPHLLDDVDPFNTNRTGNVRSTVNRSLSQPPGSYASSSLERWGSESHSYDMPGYPTCNSQWVSPTPKNEGEGSNMFQPRVGSDRTRAISRSRRSNPDKKLLHCPIAGCGATLTSRHNFKSTVSSSIS